MKQKMSIGAEILSREDVETLNTRKQTKDSLL
jgi:hypothetical protein